MSRLFLKKLLSIIAMVALIAMVGSCLADTLQYKTKQGQDKTLVIEASESTQTVIDDYEVPLGLDEQNPSAAEELFPIILPICTVLAGLCYLFILLHDRKELLQLKQEAQQEGKGAV